MMTQPKIKCGEEANTSMVLMSEFGGGECLNGIDETLWRKVNVPRAYIIDKKQWAEEEMT